MTNIRPVNTNSENAATPNVPPNTMGLPYNSSSNVTPTTKPVTRLPQQRQYELQPQQGRIVSPNVSLVPPLEDPNQPVHLPVQLNTGAVNIKQNTMAWQHHHQQTQHQQKQLQLNTTGSNSYDEHDTNDVNSDVSSIPWGSIRPDPNYDPAKDPMSPEKIDEPFVAPTEITIRVVKSRRRKTMGSFNSNSTTVTPPHVSSDDGEKYPKWHQSPATGTSSIPKLGLINSFGSDASESNSFSGPAEQIRSAEDRMHLEEDLLELQQMQEDDDDAHHGNTKQRKGMVRREFNRRMLGLKKKKEKGDFDHDDASGNKIIISVNEKLNHKLHITKPKKPKTLKKMEKKMDKQLDKLDKQLDKFTSQFSGRIKHSRTKSMRMVVGQENGC